VQDRIDIFREEERVVTLRAVLLGLALITAISVIATQSSYVLRSYRMAFGEMPISLLLFFGVIALGGNAVLKLVSPRHTLSAGELLVIFVMGSVGALIPGIAMMNTFLGTVASPYYHASPQNAWAEYLLDYIPTWLTPSNETGAVTWFYNSLPEGESIPWNVWVVPLFWWSTLVFALLVVMTSTIAILRKQWVDTGRIVFPLGEVSQELIAGAEEPGLLPGFMRGKAFWFGFAIPFGIIVWNVGSYFNPSIPRITLKVGTGQFKIAREFPEFWTPIHLVIIGFAYLANTQALLSIWLFHVLAVLQVGFSTKMGFSLGESDPFVMGDAAVVWQMTGGMIAFVILMMWRARRHLRRVLAKAVFDSPDVDDSGEMMSYRGAVLGLLLGSAYLMLMMYKAGMSPLTVATFFFIAAIMFIGIVRVVSETGFMYVRPPIVPQTFVPRLLGSAYMAPSSLAAVGMSYAMVFDNRSFCMTAIANAGKLMTPLKKHKRAITWLMVGSVMFAFLLSSLYTVYLGYRNGAVNFRVWNFAGGDRIMNTIVTKMRNPSAPDVRRIGMLGIGGTVVTALSVLCWRFPWWPLHPIGFVIANTQSTRRVALSVFIVWLVKTVVLRVGGIQGYRRARPFFIGLIAGYVAGVAVSFLVDVIWFPGIGHDFWYAL